MLGKLKSRIARLINLHNDGPRLATVGAWVFAIGSLLPLIWIIVEGGASGAVFSTQVGEQTHTIPLLNYSGVIGSMLVWAELLAISGAFILTAAPLVPVKLVRIGHGVLIAWSLLWTLGTWRLGFAAPGFWTFQALFLTLLCGCTVWRAVKCWTPPRRESVPLAGESVDPPNYFADDAACAQSPGDRESTREQIACAMERARQAAIAATQRIAAGVKAGVAAARDHDARA